MPKRATSYNVDITVPAVAVGAPAAMVSGEFKIESRVKKFSLEQIALAAFDANGQHIPVPNYQITLKRSSEEPIANLRLAAVMGTQGKPWVMPSPRDLDKAETVIVLLKVNPGSVAGVASLAFIGSEEI